MGVSLERRLMVREYDRLAYATSEPMAQWQQDALLKGCTNGRYPDRGGAV